MSKSDGTVLRMWDGKGRRQRTREHLIPLAPHAVGLVQALVSRATAQAAHQGTDPAAQLLFSTHGRVQMRPETVSARCADISASMGRESFDVRDVRRTVETMLASLAISKDTRAQLLSHGIGGVQDAHYDRHDYLTEKRAALVAWEARLEAIRQAERTHSNVVRLGRRTAA